MSSKPQLLRACRAYYDLEGNYNDQVGQYHGTNNGTSFTGGKIGQGVDLLDQNYVDIGNAMDINTGDVTACVWYYPRSFRNGNNNMIIWNGKDNSTRWGVYHDSGNNNIVLHTESSGSTTTTVSSQTLNFYQWYFIVVTRSGSNAQVFVNNMKNTGSVESGDISRSNESVIGRTKSQENDMVVDELGIWDRVLSDEEIEYLYNQSAGTNDFATYDHTYPKAQSNLDMNQNRILQVAGLQTNQVTIGDDSVYHYTPNLLGNLAVAVNGDVAHILFNVSAPLINLSSQISSQIEVGTGVASGTTGNDNKFTVFADGTNNRITFENRLGQSESVTFLHLL